MTQTTERYRSGDSGTSGLSGNDDERKSVVVRNGDLESDRSVVICLMSKNLPRHTDDRTFDWLYRANPHGQGRLWIAALRNDTVIGAAAAFPRRMYVEGGETTCWVLGDFFIDAPYRSLGPALALQRACLDQVNVGAVPFCYDFPSLGMMAIYKRLGLAAFGQMTRFAKALRADRKVRGRIANPLLNATVTAAGNLLLGLRDSVGQGGARFNVSDHAGECGREFTELARWIGHSYGACVLRSADYLNWRYRSHPSCPYEIITARRNGELVAYAIFSQDGEDATLADLFGVAEQGVIDDLIDYLTRLLKARKVVTLSTSFIESHPWIPLFRRLGFHARDEHPVVVYGPARMKPILDSGWFVMSGDRDS